MKIQTFQTFHLHTRNEASNELRDFTFKHNSVVENVGIFKQSIKVCLQNYFYLLV